MVVVVLAIALLALMFYFFVVKKYDYWKDRGVKQGSTVWIFGDNWAPLLRLTSMSEMIVDSYRKFPGTRYSGSYQFMTPNLVVRDPELIKKITVKDFEHFVDHRTLISEEAEPLFSKNLFALKGKKWRDMRTILSPSFTSSKMKSMFLPISNCADKFVQHFVDKNEDLITLEMKDVFTRYTNDVIATSAFGIEVDSLRDPDNEFYTLGRRFTDFAGILRTLKFFGYFLFPKLYSLLKIQLFATEESAFFTNLIYDNIRAREEKGIVRNDMIQLLLEARKGKQKHEENGVTETGFAAKQQESEQTNEKLHREITDEDIAAQALIFFFAGFETVSTLLCFLSHELAVNPDVQNKLRAEIKSTSKENGGKLTYEALTKMKYMDMVISEVLRKWPAAVATERVCTKPYSIEPERPDENPLQIEEGTVITLPTIGIHRDPKYYPNPDKFDPERFSDENKDKINPYAYFPFGLGPRICIGNRFALLETKALFFRILKHFELVPVEKTGIPLKISRTTFNLSAEGGFWTGLKRIKV